MKSYFALLPAFLLLLAVPTIATAQAPAQQNHAIIHDTIVAFVLAQTKTLPGKIDIKVNDIDRRLVRPACPKLEAFLPPGSRLLGNSMAGIRCPGKRGWTLFVPVHVKINVDMVITNRSIQPGQKISAEDLSKENGEMTQRSILTDPKKAIGKVLKFGIGAGQFLRQDMLREPYAVTQGQIVQIIIEGAGFIIRTEGHALNNASVGQTVKVKTTSGKVVGGSAKSDGVVGIRP